MASAQVKIFPSMNVTYSQAGFHSDQVKYLSTKVLVFAEPGHMLFLLKPY